MLGHFAQFVQRRNDKALFHALFLSILRTLFRESFRSRMYERERERDREISINVKFLFPKAEHGSTKKRWCVIITSDSTSSRTKRNKRARKMSEYFINILSCSSKVFAILFIRCPLARVCFSCHLVNCFLALSLLKFCSRFFFTVG